MKITTRTVNDVTIIDLSGRLDIQASESVSDILIHKMTGKKKVLLNLEKLEFLGSAGLRVLLRAIKHINKSGGKMKVCNVPPRPKQVIELTNLDTVLDLYDSESSALAAF